MIKLFQRYEIRRNIPLWSKQPLSLLILLCIGSAPVRAEGDKKAAFSKPTTSAAEKSNQLPDLIMGGHYFRRDQDGALRLPGKIEGAKCGFIDESGQFVLQPEFEDAGQFSEGLAGVKKGGKWGFIDRKGTMVIAPTFEQVSEFGEGLCAVKFNGWWRYIDKSGSFAMKAQFAGLTNGVFKDGVAEVQLTGSDYKSKRIDRNGNILPDQTAFPEVEGMKRFKRGGKYGFQDSSGHEVIPPIFQYADDFSEGVAVVFVYNKAGYIDKHGKFVIPLQFEQGGRFQYGLARVGGFMPDTSYLIDKFGKRVTNFKIVLDENFSDGFVREKINGKYAFADRTGHLLADKYFDDAKPFYNGFAAVKVGTKYGVIDKTGKFIAPPQFTWVGRFQEGLLPVRIGGVYKPGPAISR